MPIYKVVIFSKSLTFSHGFLINMQLNPMLILAIEVVRFFSETIRIINTIWQSVLNSNTNLISFKSKLLAQPLNSSLSFNSKRHFTSMSD